MAMSKRRDVDVPTARPREKRKICGREDWDDDVKEGLERTDKDRTKETTSNRTRARINADEFAFDRAPKAVNSEQIETAGRKDRSKGNGHPRPAKVSSRVLNPTMHGGRTDRVTLQECAISH